MVPVYVRGVRPAVLTVTPNVPLVPNAGESTSQALLADAFQVTGRAQVPVSLNVTFCVAADCPCDTEKARLAGAGVESTQGGCIVRVTTKVCELPSTASPVASLEEMVTSVVYVPTCRPAILAATTILPD